MSSRSRIESVDRQRWFCVAGSALRPMTPSFIRDADVYPVTGTEMKGVSS